MEFYTKEQLQITYNCGLSDGKFNNIDYSITDSFAPIEEPKQERSYSEEDLREAFYNGWLLSSSGASFRNAIEKWFEQLKINKI